MEPITNEVALSVAVVAGGIGTLLVVLVVAGIWPDIRHLTTLREMPQEQTSEHDDLESADGVTV